VHSLRIRFLLGLLPVCLLASACGFKSTTFLGVHGSGTQQKLYGVVAQSAVEPIDQFLKEWIHLWENGSGESCYQKFQDSIKSEWSQTKFQEMVEDLKNRYGEPHGIANLEQPLAQILPARDEALFERSTEAAFKYYSYVSTTYLNQRPVKNLVYVFFVGMKNGQFTILGFSIYEQVRNLQEKPTRVFGFGISPE